MTVITKENLLDYNAFKTPAVMGGDEAMCFEAEAFLKKTIAKNQKIILAKSMIFTKSELNTRPKAALTRLFNESIKNTKNTDCKAILVEPYLWDKKTSLDKDEVKKIYLDAAEILKDTDIKIYVKNQYDLYNGNIYRGFLSDTYQIKEFINGLNKIVGRKAFYLALDTGVAALCGQNVPELIKTLADEIAIIILNENNGIMESTAVPFSNICQDQTWTDWRKVIIVLRDIKYKGDLLIDFNWNSQAIPAPLKPVMKEYVNGVGSYFESLIDLESIIRKYESRVLFGAGNMCRIYMERYGVEYPPLFTCDNNKAKCGSQAFGLEIKSPEALKELAPSTAIFICNMYYDEIYSQLKSMNLPNPIEIFNDEIF